MKKLLFAVAILVATSVSAQSYISVSGGYAIPSAGVKFGEMTTVNGVENSYGSYGEGINTQIRFGHFFNETFGLDLGIAYLHGTDQTVTSVDVPGMKVDAIARGRAFGFTPSVVYKFTDNLYGRFGALIKIGGKTEAVVSSMSVFSDAAAAAQGLPSGSYSQTNYVEDFHGQLPLGFVAAFGYKRNIGNNLDLFVEAEYMGVSVKRKDSEIVEFNTDIVLPTGDIAVAGFYSLDNLAPGYVKKTTYVDDLPLTNTDATKKLAQKVPYSSFGINFGITYTFSKSSK